MQIKVVKSHDDKKFEQEVNKLLTDGWKLHGPPNFNAVPQQATWDGGDLRSWVSYSFTQCLVKE